MSGAESRKVVAPETNQQTNQPTAESSNQRHFVSVHQGFFLKW